MNRIKEVLEDKGIKQVWLAERLGKSFNSVNGYVQNRTQPSLETFSLDYITLDKAIENLTKDYPRQAETIQLRYFHGLKNKEIAQLHQISESLVDKDLKFSKSWMRIHA